MDTSSYETPPESGIVVPPISLKERYSLPPFLSNSDGAKYIKDQVTKIRRPFRQQWSHKKEDTTQTTTDSTPLHSAAFTEVAPASETSLPDIEVKGNQNPFRHFLFPPRNEVDINPSSLLSADDVSRPRANGKVTSASFTNLATGEEISEDVPLYNQLREGSNQLRRRKSIASFSTPPEDQKGSGRRRTIGVSSSRYTRKGKERDPSRKSSSRSPSNFTGSDLSHNLDSSSDQQRWKNKAHSQPYVINHKMLQRRLRVGYLSHEFVRSLYRRNRSIRDRVSSSVPYRPIDRFRRIVSIIRLLIRCLDRKISMVSQISQMSFALLSREMTVTRTYTEGLYFDSSEYKATTEAKLNEKVRNILTIVPYRRTEKQVSYALKRLRAAVEEFAEFPLRMQEALVKVAWLDEFEPKRVIIRQGHKAETFYFIISGTALVTKNRLNASGDGYVETVQILKRGKSFGELAIVRHEQRTSNVVSQTQLTLLTVARDEFIDIFMHRMDGEEPEFITFLSKLPEFQGFPLYKLPRRKPETCAFTYFRVGVVICADSSKSDMIVIVKSGFCRVIKKLKVTKPNLPGLQRAPESFTYDKVNLDNIKNTRFGQRASDILTSPTSPVSLLTGPKRRMINYPQPIRRTRTDLTLYDPNYIPKHTSPSISLPGSLNEHKNDILLRHMKWQNEHPISRDTFALLMTGREEEDDNENDDVDKFQQYVQESSFDQSEDDFGRRDSLQSNFRSQILRRSRKSLANAWMYKGNKKVSTASSMLPTLNETLSTPGYESEVAQENKEVCVHIQTLGERDIFGLLPILFDASEGATSVSLVSEGSECILISKEFFLKHFDEELRERLVRMVQPYP
ncbi:uncharacterized protein LOC100177622 [Ciona intestinalis]